MKILANRVRKSNKQNIIYAVFGMIFFGVMALFVLEGTMRILAASVIVILPLLCIRYHFWAKKFNSNETPPVWGTGSELHFYDGKTTLSVPCRKIISIEGKNKKYFHFYGYVMTWGTCNYGKLTVRFCDEFGNKQKIVIFDVAEPESAAYEVTQYQRAILSGDTGNAENADFFS